MTTVLTNATAAIKQTIENFTIAWNNHDAIAFASLFAEDADFTNVFGQTFHGRTAIEAQHAPIFATLFKDSHVAVQEIRARMLCHDLAAVDVRWTMSGATDFKGNQWPDRLGLMNLVMKQEAEIWYILVMHNMDLPVVSLS